MPGREIPRSARSGRVLVEFAVDRGVAGDRILRGSGVTLDRLREPDAEITFTQEQRLVENLVAAFPDQPEIGLDVGRRSTVTAFGMLGIATLTSPTLRDSLEIALRYVDLGSTLARLQLVPDPPWTAVDLDVRGLPAPIHRFVVDRQLATFWTAFPSITADEPPAVRIELAFPPPLDPAPYRDWFGRGPELGRRHHRLWLPDSYLDRALPQADPETVALCERQCRDQLTRRAAQVGYAGLVHDRLTRAASGIPDMVTIARDLHTTPRTLRRQLRADGETFRNLSDAARKQRAERLLRHTTLTLDAVATECGYETASALSHAFRRWHGTTPGTSRRTAHGGTP